SSASAPQTRSTPPPRCRCTRWRAERSSLRSIYQLVTPVSGAVVLETKAQYQTAGLQPVDAASVPAVPEPPTWILLGVGLLVLADNVRRRRRFTDCESRSI